MILRLRQRHRRMFAAIGVVVPILFVVGIAARRPVPRVTSLPAELTPASGRFVPTDGELWNLFRSESLRVRLLYQPGTNRRAIRLFALRHVAKPDLLVYWAAGNPVVTDRLPENATLLGAFEAHSLELPADARNTDGVLILFSLADQEIVDVSKPSRFVDSVK